MKIISKGPSNYYGMMYVECDEEKLYYYLIVPGPDGDDRIQISAYLAMGWENDFPLDDKYADEDEDDDDVG